MSERGRAEEAELTCWFPFFSPGLSSGKHSPGSAGEKLTINPPSCCAQKASRVSCYGASLIWSAVMSFPITAQACCQREDGWGKKKAVNLSPESFLTSWLKNKADLIVPSVQPCALQALVSHSCIKITSPANQTGFIFFSCVFLLIWPSKYWHLYFLLAFNWSGVSILLFRFLLSYLKYHQDVMYSCASPLLLNFTPNF